MGLGRERLARQIRNFAKSPMSFLLSLCSIGAATLADEQERKNTGGGGGSSAVFPGRIPFLPPQNPIRGHTFHPLQRRPKACSSPMAAHEFCSSGSGVESEGCRVAVPSNLESSWKGSISAAGPSARFGGMEGQHTASVWGLTISTTSIRLLLFRLHTTLTRTYTLRSLHAVAAIAA